ncbi:ABC transporter ATP-binding protein [Siculibacillus lacustris]|uniref:ABC transporter ATP-binding protein n=1 Tax=Siculibacillus lacustris TaxID=1549641 RepID=A0A4Q9VSK2_9HYPH|nr:ABC transporter ATP-binding protein [Siculibacillus lacustris]TBW38977.1 ABC transporter ATP-binding protein [Siculibacillus lacustris]
MIDPTAAARRPPLFALEGLEVSFPGRPVVRGLDLSVAEGETVALVGESGCGKSTTALAAMRLLPRSGRIDAGRIAFEGRDLAVLSPAELRDLRGRRLAMIFQEPMTSLNPVLTIGRQIAEVLIRHEHLSRRAARARAIELLDLVRIAEPHRRIDDHPHRLSGGMRQRVMIAIAVACRPKLLFADEPTTALDVTIQAQVLDLLDRLRRDLGMALVLITHDLGVVAQYADRVVVMYAGHKVEEATTAELFARPLHPYTRGLLAAAPRLDTGLHHSEGRLAEIPGAPDGGVDHPGCAFAPRCPEVRADCRVTPPRPLAIGDRLVACPPAVASAPRANAMRGAHDAVG